MDMLWSTTMAFLAHLHQYARLWPFRFQTAQQNVKHDMGIDQPTHPRSLIQFLFCPSWIANDPMLLRAYSEDWSDCWSESLLYTHAFFKRFLFSHSFSVFFFFCFVFFSRFYDFQSDVIAGLTVALTVVPQGLAYANIANLPPQVRIKKKKKSMKHRLYL